MDCAEAVLVRGLQAVIAVAEVPEVPGMPDVVVSLGRAGFEEGRTVEFDSGAAGQEVVGCEESDFGAVLEEWLGTVKLVWRAAVRLLVADHLAKVRVQSARVASVHTVNYTYCY